MSNDEHRSAKTTQDGKPPRGSIGRPKAEKPRSQWVSFRVTAEEHFQILDKAQRSAVSAGHFAVRAFFAASRGAEKSGPALPLPFGEMTQTIYQELRRQGVNLNQIAHHCNRHQVLPPPEVSQLAATIIELWQKVLPR